MANVTNGGEHSLQFSIPIVECGRVVGHDRLLAVPGARGQFVVGCLVSAQNAPDTGLSAFRIHEIVFEWRSDQFVSRAAGEGLRLLVYVGDALPDR